MSAISRAMGSHGDSVILIACLAMVGMIFLLDVVLPIGIVGSMLYIIPVTIAFRMRRPGNPYLIVSLSILLTFVAAVPRSSEEVLLVAFNRPICAGILIAVSYMGMMMRRDEKARDELVRGLEQAMGKVRVSNENLQQFTYAASHDLREPLRMISGYMTLLRDRYSDQIDERGREYIDIALDGAMHMDAMMIDLLAYSKAGMAPIEMRSVDLKEVVERALMNLGNAIKSSGATIEAATLPTLCADRTQMIQVFQNLIGNAIRFRGEVRPVIKIAATEGEEEWELAVIDNGIGIPPDQQGRLFQMFVRLHVSEVREGTGVGLALVKRIVERHGGRIWVESDGVHGSTFRFTVPKVPDVTVGICESLLQRNG